MGHSVFLTPKTRDDEILLKIMKCSDKRKNKFLSDKFALFQSRYDFDQSEFKQVQKILSIDLNVFLKYPNNHFYDTGELEYKLYLAEEANDRLEISKIKIRIEEEKNNWELDYELNNDGWSKVEDFRAVIFNLIKAINTNLEFGNEIVVPDVISFPWGDYFSAKNKNDSKEERFLDDLDTLLFKLKCIERSGIKYVGLVGE